METKFQELKSKFAKQPIRGYPEYQVEMFELTTDFSAKNLGAILSKVQQGNPE